jgi:hypothetical protein
MNKTTLIALLFVVAALYDAGLGVAFLLAPSWIYRVAEITPPNHWAYVQFPAALLVIFGLMFAAIAVRPYQNRNLIPYGILLKAAYCGIVFLYWTAEGIPGLWKPFAVIDLLMGLLFLGSYWYLTTPSAKAVAQQ